MGNYLKTYKSQKNLCFGYKNYYVDETKLITFIVIFACFLGIVLDKSNQIKMTPNHFALVSGTNEC